MKDECGINVCECFGIFEHDVSCPLGLMSGPVVGHWHVFEQKSVDGIEHSREAVQGGGPSEMNLLVHKLLGFGDILQTDKAVIAPVVAELGFVHEAGEPFTAVQADLDGKGQPRLNAGVHETKDGIDEVMIKREAFAVARHQLQAFSVAVAKDLEADAGFDSSEHADEAGSDAIALHDFAGDGFLVGIGAGQVLNRTLLDLGGAHRSVTQLGSQMLGVGTEVFEQNVFFPEQTFKSFDVADRAQGAAKDQTVESAQSTRDLVGMICYKTVHGVLLKRRFVSQTLSTFSRTPCLFFIARVSRAGRLGCG